MTATLREQAYSTDVFDAASKEWQRLLSSHMQRVSAGDSPVLNEWRSGIIC